LAGKIAAHAQRTGGRLTVLDLASHKSEWVEPLSAEYQGYRIHELPPNSQGIAALIMLGILEHHDLSSFHPDSAESLHLQIEAMKLAFADVHQHVSDPLAMTVDCGRLLDPAYLSRRASLIDMKRAQEFTFGQPLLGDTVYLSAADAGGMMVSFIQSNYQGFGSGIVVPGTGISLQNRGACFNLIRGHPNEVGGNKRPFHTIIPSFVTKGDKPVMSFGVMGGPMQPQGHGQLAVRIFCNGQNPQAASDAPRWQVACGRRVLIEEGAEPTVLSRLRQMGHDAIVAPGEMFGGSQLIYCLPEGYCAASDHRKDGQAVGF
jgi:gamma-glutamyltranspeptidase/glutathione hydrolase